MSSTRVPRAGVLALLASLVLLVGACGGTTPATASPPAPAAASPSAIAAAAPSPSPSPTATPVPTPTPSPTPAPMALCGKEQTSCTVAAGVWYPEPFDPSFDITVGDGWSNDWNYPKIGALSNAQGSFVWMTGVFSVDEKSMANVKLSNVPADLAAFLKEKKGLSVADPTPVEIDGAPGLQVDATATRRLNFVFVTTPIGPQTQANSASRYYLVDHDGTTVVFIAAADDKANTDAFMTEVQPMVESIAWR